jgi:hypothetical protein
MLLKWQSSISIFSQIWKYSKYESRNLNHLFIFKAIVANFDDFKIKIWGKQLKGI